MEKNIYRGCPHTPNMTEATESISSSSLEWFIVNTITKMRDANAENDKDKYFVYFNYALRTAIPYLSTHTRASIEKDYDTFRGYEKAIKEDAKLNEATKQLKIRELKEQFADTHQVFIFIALSKMGIIKVREEGVISFEKLDIDQIATVIRSQKGLVKQVENQLRKNEVSEPEAAPNV